MSPVAGAIALVFRGEVCLLLNHKVLSLAAIRRQVPFYEKVLRLQKVRVNF